MGQLNHQLGIVDEVTYGTPPVVTRFYEFLSEGIEEKEGRTESEPLRAGFTKRNDRFTPYFSGAAGSVELNPLTKGFGLFLKHMLGSVVTTGPAEVTAFTHTASMADLLGKFFTLQVNRPFHPTGTDQAFTYSGGKVTDWTVSNSVDGDLVVELGMDFQTVSDAVALATASYPAGMETFTWAGGTLLVGAVAVDITEFSVKGSNNLDVDRRFIRGNTLKKEPTGGKREVEFSLSCDFESLTQRARAHATTRAGALASIQATWLGPTIIAGATTIKPTFDVTIPAGRFDEWKGAVKDGDGIKQELSGVGLFDGTNSPVTIVYKSADTTA